jgi:hypothetical protein
MIDRDPDATIGPVRRLAAEVVATALRDALAGRPVSELGLRPWLPIAGLNPELLPEILERAKRVSETRARRIARGFGDELCPAKPAAGHATDADTPRTRSNAGGRAETSSQVLPQRYPSRWCRFLNCL